jgi:hypothetical protein
MNKKEEVATQEAKFTKQQLLQCKDFKKDLVNVVLEDNKFYTKQEAQELINKFLNRRVR